MNEDAKTVEALHVRYAGLIYDHCTRILNDRMEAEDAVQETFVSAYRALSSFTYQESYLPWLYRIATNVCLKVIRTRRRKGMLLIEHPERAKSPELEPSRMLFARRILQTLMHELDELSQEILVAHYFTGMTQGQIAHSLHISRRAVVKRLTAVRARVNRILEEDSSNG